MGLKRSKDFILTLSDDDAVSQSESEYEAGDDVVTKKRKIDDDLNPDFEFDGHGVLDGLKEIQEDEWGFSGVSGMMKGNGVDLEGIIKRRRQNMLGEKEDEDGREAATASLNSDSESDGNTGFQDFEDDDMGILLINCSDSYSR